MKTLWNAVSFLAVVNLIMLILFIGWLVNTDRLTTDRLNSIREMLSRTVAEEERTAAASAAAEERLLLDTLEQQRRENPYPPAAQHIAYVHRLEQTQRDLSRRSETEMRHLQSLLERMREELTAEREQFEAERSEWDAHRTQIASREQDGQFRQVVQLLEGVPAKQAKDMFAGLMRDGKASDAVAYLNAMKPFNASKVLREFKTDEEKRLATELLERLKTLVAPAGGGGVAGSPLDADADASQG